MNFKKGYWVSYQFRDRRGVLRSITGVVVEVTSHGLVTVRSDGGQPGYPRGKRFSVWGGELRDLRRNPAAKGRKVKGGRAVTVRNFTGTVVRKSEGTVEILGTGRRR